MSLQTEKKTIEKIVSFSTSENTKVFCLKVKPETTASVTAVYYADIESEPSLERESIYNKGCLKTSIGKTYKTYHALYNSTDLYYKSGIYNAVIDVNDPTTYDFQNVFNYRLSDELTNCIQIDNYIYSLNGMNVYGKFLFDSDIYSELSINNGYNMFPNKLLSTYTYDKQRIKDNIKEKKDIYNCINNTYNEIKYNQIFEFPGNIQIDYDSGNMNATVYQCKNQYNSIYNMQHDSSYKLTHARKYVGIDHCNNQIYLKFYDNVKYDNNMNISINDKCLYDQKYPRIEVIDGVNRYESLNQHKSNLYSVDIISEKLFKQMNKTPAKDIHKDLNDDQKMQIITVLKNEIANCITDICNKISPIDTQIMNVNVLESQIK